MFARAIFEFNSYFQKEAGFKDLLSFLRQCAPTLVGTFVGAGLSFCVQTVSSNRSLEKKLEDTIVRFYRENTVNLSVLLTFKNVFFNDGKERLRNAYDFLAAYLNCDDRTKVEMLPDWRGIFVREFFALINSDVSAAGVVKQRWEKPDFISPDLEEISQVSRYSPNILRTMSYLKSSTNLLLKELEIRDKLANEFGKYVDRQDDIRNLSSDTPKDLFLLLQNWFEIAETVDRCLALSFGLSALLETQFLFRFNSINFKISKFSVQNLQLLPTLRLYNNFYGDDMAAYIVEQRYMAALNNATGHRELNFPTAILSKKL